MARKAIAATLTAGRLWAGAAGAVDPPNFDFNGYANIPGSVGGTLTLRSVLTNNGEVPTPIALDFTNDQYTVVVVATLASAPSPQQYTPATIAIYSDPIAGGTAADYGTPSTFTDGTLILGGTFDGELLRSIFTATLGAFSGQVNFTSGTRLGDLATPQDWAFGGGWSRSVSGIPAGYDENWDGVISQQVVGVEPRIWQDVKSLYRGN
jgi:hypothetical protein